MIVGCVEFDSGANKSVAFSKPLEYVVLAKISLNRIEVNREESKIMASIRKRGDSYLLV